MTQRTWTMWKPICMGAEASQGVSGLLSQEVPRCQAWSWVPRAGAPWLLPSPNSEVQYKVLVKGPKLAVQKENSGLYCLTGHLAGQTPDFSSCLQWPKHGQDIPQEFLDPSTRPCRVSHVGPEKNQMLGKKVTGDTGNTVWSRLNASVVSR